MAGTADDFDEAAQAAFRAKLAIFLDVSSLAMTLIILPGSVVVQVVVTLPDVAARDRVLTQMTSLLSQADPTDTLGLVADNLVVELVAAPRFASVFVAPPPPASPMAPPPSSAPPSIVYILLAAVAIAIALFCVFQQRGGAQQQRNEMPMVELTNIRPMIR